MDEEAAFVKTQIDHHAKTAAWHGKNNRLDKQSRHLSLHKRFMSLSAKIRELQENGVSALSPEFETIGNRLGDLSDVPEHIRKQLVSAQVDELEQKILDVIKTQYGGAANIDEIMVGLWRMFEIGDKDREFLARKLYRMVRSNSVFSVPKKKGVYSLMPPKQAGDHEKQSPPKIDMKDILGTK